MNRSLKKHFSWTVLLMVFVIASCKQLAEPGSSSQSLDNFGENTALKINYCQKNQSQDAGINKIYGERNSSKSTYISSLLNDPSKITWSKDNEIKSHLTEVLEIVPEVMLKMFFAKGTLELSTETPTLCKNLAGNSQFAKENSDQDKYSAPMACWGEDGGNPKIALIESPEAIRHALLRSFAMVYAFVVEKSGGQDESFAIERKNLDAIVKGYENDLKKVGKELPNTSDVKTVLFAETIDSFLCSKETHNVFRSCYRNAYQAMLQGVVSNEDRDEAKCSAAMASLN